MQNNNSSAVQEVNDQAEYMHFLKNAPIMEFAQYAGINIDEAVQRRVDAAIADAPVQMEIAVRPIQPQGNLYGFATINIAGIKVDDFKILQNNDGNLFVGMPSKPDKSSQTGFRNTVLFDKDIKEALNGLIISRYFEEAEQAQARAANQRQPQQPPPQQYGAAQPRAANQRQAQQQPYRAAQPRAVNQRQAQQPPPQQQPIAAQYRQAQQQANQHNAALPAQQQGNNKFLVNNTNR